ncbi:MAG: SPASM domain-containing protein [Parvibaculaceae bacterium]
MESVYWVLSWACHRKCVHCYDDRFRPYVRDELESVIAEGEQAFQKIIANLPHDMSFADAAGERKASRIILSGGEVLLDGFRQRIFFPTLEAIQKKWHGENAVIVSIQTTGDLLEEEHLIAMLERGVRNFAISGFDDFHVGMTQTKRDELAVKIDAMMARHNVRKSVLGAPKTDDDAPRYIYFGAQPDSWIGDLWPRGRAWLNSLSKANYETNFCARHSGAKGFMNMGQAGSEVAIEPNGNVFPCCLKTKVPLGNLTEEPLVQILESLRGVNFFESLNRGDPEGMATHAGKTREEFRALSTTKMPDGRDYSNGCIGCDKLFEEQVGDRLREIRAQRLGAMQSNAPSPAVSHSFS